MMIFARGTFTEPQRIAALVEDELRVVEVLKARGLMRQVYRRVAEPGVVMILEAQDIDTARKGIDTLPFVMEGVMTVEYEEVYPV